MAKSGFFSWNFGGFSQKEPRKKHGNNKNLVSQAENFHIFWSFSTYSYEKCYYFISVDLVLQMTTLSLSCLRS